MTVPFVYNNTVFTGLRLLLLLLLLANCPAGAKLTYLPFIVKALSLTLAKFPGLNVCLEQGGAALLQRSSHNIGVAMATSNGLVVPNVKQVGCSGSCGA
jgi:pyruvate/2-oxoglutarate dehydrogenase complex dihydrolipoamide acyltransferase (E2) component